MSKSQPACDTQSPCMILFAHGETFDVDAYLAMTSLVFDSIWHKGQWGNDLPAINGVVKLFRDTSAKSLCDQERIAIEYMTSNRNALKELANRPGVTTFNLGLQYRLEIEMSETCITIGPSTSLMECALDIGFLPVYYITMDWNGEEANSCVHSPE